MMNTQATILPKPQPISQIQLQILGNQLLLKNSAEANSDTPQTILPLLKNFFESEQFHSYIITDQDTDPSHHTHYHQLTLTDHGIELIELSETNKTVYSFNAADNSLRVNNQPVSDDFGINFLNKLEGLIQAVSNKKMKILGVK